MQEHNFDPERKTAMFKVSYINTCLGNKYGEETYECFTEQEAYEKFTSSHRSFCEVQSVKLVKRVKR